MADARDRLLEASAARLRQRTILLGAAGAATGATSAAFFDASWQFVGFANVNVIQSSLPFAAPIAASAFAAFAIALWGDWRALISRTHLALAVDKKANLNLAYATAVDVKGEHATRPLAQNLLASADAAAAAFDVASAWPLLTRPIISFVAATFVIGSLTSALYLGPLNAQPSTHIVSPTEIEDLRKSAQDLSDRLRQEAVLRDEPVLEAIARAIRERIVQAEPDATQDQLQEALAALLDQASTAFGDRPPSWLNADRFTNDQAQGSNADAAIANRADASLRDGIDMYAMDLDAVEQIRRDWEALDILDAANVASNEMDNPGGEITPGTAEAPPSAAMSMQKLEPKQLQIAAREAVGASADSGKGPADQAGGGSSDLLGESFALGANGAEDFSLPQSTQETGRRIRISLPPSESEQGLAGAGSGEAGATVSAHAPVPVTRSTISASHRSTLSRYFEKVSE
ncbi:hypothetical protein JHC09_02675 [Devosia sp. MC532]|uniref:hypothetical protein n=1 Tax=Devosia sp. MC532 TaxID=2799788 RepID=UPI0018F76180|nr:hypothetical protein [Devosia sp. MC532]MBJ7576784.1 hypothetical protein [Devosia sp. MC532]